MSEGFIVVVAVLIFVVITLAKGVRILPQGEEWIVERLGKYHGTLKPGLNLIIPYLDKVAYKLVTKDIILDVQEQAAAERERKAAVTKAEGAKQAAILEAEARLESAKRDADAQVMLAEASAEAIRRVAAAIGDQPGPMMYMLGEKYIAAIERMGSADSAKVVVLPADLQETVRGLLARGKLAV